MTEPDEIRQVLSIFHDGWISRGAMSDGTGEIEVQVEYLAERARPGGRAFLIRLEGLDRLRFSPWSEEGRPVISEIVELPEIARLELGLLSAECVESSIRVACTQDRPGFGFSGGFLEFCARGCRVFDETGHEWDLDGLRKLADDYWEEWSARNSKAQQAAPSDGDKPSI